MLCYIVSSITNNTFYYITTKSDGLLTRGTNTSRSSPNARMGKGATGSRRMERGSLGIENSLSGHLITAGCNLSRDLAKDGLGNDSAGGGFDSFTIGELQIEQNKIVFNTNFIQFV